ncbi:MAG: 6-carboxytetrahydropterin synthase [Candidatus Dadabacteria bacterium]|nr:6-carboxytetrahydropterin synthase [Candidatus Dadabacteria bacterium]
MGYRKLLTKRMDFSASHRYWNPGWSEEKNREVFGKSASPHGHGHNYALELTVEGEADPETGMIINLYDLKKIMKEVLEDFDHKHLNEDNPHFRTLVPTTENIARVLWDGFKEKIPGDGRCRLYRVRLYETRDMYVDYWRDED